TPTVTGFMAERLLEMLVIDKRDGHEIWQPEAEPEPGIQPEPEDPAIAFAVPGLTEPERVMLRYALDQAQERIWAEDGFTDEDQAAVTSLRRLLTGKAPDQRLARAREVHRETCLLAQSEVKPTSFTCSMCEALDESARL